MSEEMNEFSKKLEQLQAALVDLQTQNLQTEAQSALKSALDSLTELSGEITANQEQSRLAALYNVSRALGTSLDQNEVLQQVMDAVIRLTGAERGFLVLVEGEGEELHVRVGRNMDQEALQGDEMKFSRTVVQTAIDKAEAVLTTDAQGDPRFAQKESIVGMALRSIMCAPLMSRDKVIGVIYVDNRAKTAMFDRDDLDMLNAFASQAAAAIQNARLYEDTDRSLADRLEELENLAQASREMNMQDSMEGVLAVAREWALKSTGAAGAWIAIYQTENGERSVRVLAGPASGERMAEDDPVLAKVMAANTPHIFGPEGEQPARVAVPILVEEKSVGVMVLENEKPFSVEALHFASRLANQAMIAIEKAKLAERIDDAKMEKAQFVSVVAHELRIPMTSIQGYTDLLKQGAIGPVNEQQLEFLSVIRNNVGRMSMLVSDLSDIYKVESGRLLVEPIALPMRGMVERAIEGLQAHIDGKNQTVENQVAEELPKVFGDPKRVEQVLVNLLRNASMYSREGAKIEVAARLDGDFIVTRVTDQGYGLSAEEQLEIFSQFFRSERTEVREQLGWGLGLSLVKNLVALMGGEAGFESVLDKGSTFWFSLPVAS